MNTPVNKSMAVDPSDTRDYKEEIRSLKSRDNVTNFLYILRVYTVILVTLALTIWFLQSYQSLGLNIYWTIPVSLISIIIIGASQHQLGGAAHEATHYILFRNKKLNELASDFLCMLPLYTTTFQFRIHHLSHHQFVNDPDKDLDIAQLRESGHWLDFPITHITFLWTLLKQLWLPNLIRYTIARVKYSTLGTDKNPYAKPEKQTPKWPNRFASIYALLTPTILGLLDPLQNLTLLILATVIPWAMMTAYYMMIPADSFPNLRIQPVIPHRITAIHRTTYLALLYGALAIIAYFTRTPTWIYYLLFWILPLFTSFALFMMLRQVVQHGNADRGRLTNTRIFLVNPLIRYAIFPFGMDYHLPHHLYASVPHYKLKKLHKLLKQYDPDYQKNGQVVEGYFSPPSVKQEQTSPTVMEVLGPEYAVKDGENKAYIDNDALEYAELK